MSIWEGSYGKSTIYPQDHGENLYRRSLYTYLKRMAPPPNTGAFDATDRSAVCVGRQRTNTPLAALVLCGAHRADKVMIAGQWRVVDGVPPGADLHKLRSEHGKAALAALG